MQFISCDKCKRAIAKQETPYRILIGNDLAMSLTPNACKSFNICLDCVHRLLEILETPPVVALR